MNEAELLGWTRSQADGAGVLAHHAVNFCPACGLVLPSGPAGFPDLVLIGWNGALFRELKSRAGILSSSQRRWRDRLAGNHFHTARGDVPVWDVWRDPVDRISGRIGHELAAIA